MGHPPLSLKAWVDDDGAIPFEASIETFVADGQEGIRWSSPDLTPPILQRATELFAEGLTVREVAATLRISKSEAGRLRQRAFEEGLIALQDGADLDGGQVRVQ